MNLTALVHVMTMMVFTWTIFGCAIVLFDIEKERRRKMTDQPDQPPQLPALWYQGINQRGDSFRARFPIRPIAPPELPPVTQEMLAQVQRVQTVLSQRIANHQQRIMAQLAEYRERCDICGGTLKSTFDAIANKVSYEKDVERCRGACEPTDLREAPPQYGWRYLTREEATEAVRAGMRAGDQIIREVFNSDVWTGRGDNIGGGNGGG